MRRGLLFVLPLMTACRLVVLAAVAAGLLSATGRGALVSIDHPMRPDDET